MSEQLITTEGTHASQAYTPSQVLARFDLKLARPFIYKSLSEETRAAYHRAIREFFQFVGGVIPLNPATTKLVTPPALPTDPQGTIAEGLRCEN
jgi:hypothetical protein